MKRLLVLVMLLSALPSISTASMAPPPPKYPPMGWEQRVTPGFEPSVESVLAREQVSDDQILALWKGWGPGAVDVVMKLYQDPQWQAFHALMLRLLLVNPYEDAPAAIERMLHMLAASPDLSKGWSDFRMLAQNYARRRPDRGLPFLKDLASKSDSPQVIKDSIYALLSLRTPEAIAAAEELINRLADPKERDAMKPSLDHARGYLRAKEPMK